MARNESSGNGRQVRMSELVPIIEQTMKQGLAAFVWGPPGIGKSDIIAQIGERTNRPVIDVRLLLMEPTDIKGIPYYNAADKTMKWAKPTELPEVVDEVEQASLQARLDKLMATEERVRAQVATLETALDSNKVDPGQTQLLAVYKAELKDLQDSISQTAGRLAVVTKLLPFQNAILFLDELNAAPASVQAAAYQLILNRRVGEYALPSGVSIVAAGNRETDKAVANRMPTPLANRFFHVELDVNYIDWRTWAVTQGNIHPDVVGFLEHSKGKLFDFNPRSGEKAFATPRSWSFVSKLLDDSFSEKMTGALVAGCVGEGVATEFMAHRRHAKKLPLAEDVLSGKVKKLQTSETSAIYSLTISMCYTLREAAKLIDDDKSKMDSKTFHEMADYFFAFMMDNYQTEMTILGARIALKEYSLPIQHRELKNFDKFFEENHKYVFGDD